MSNAPPSIDPADQDSLLGTIRVAFDKLMQGTDDMLPARVVAFNRAKNRVQVQPLIRVVTTAGETIARAQIASLPVMQIGGGDAVLLFKLKPGDLGWIKASDRDISLFLQNYAESRPNTYRKHSFSDAVFVPDVMRGWTLAEEDADCAVLQSLDGKLRVSLGASRVKMAAGAVYVSVTEAGITMFGNVSVVGSFGQTNGGPNGGTGAVMGGSLTINGASVQHQGKEIGRAHTHGGVQTGSGTTGAVS